MSINNTSYLEIASAGKLVLHSGVVHSYDNSSLKFTISNLHIQFSFVEDGGKPDMVVDIQNDTLLSIVLHNFSSSVGTGTDSPVSLGIMGGRQLALAFTVQALSKDSIKLLAYTFFLGDKV